MDLARSRVEARKWGRYYAPPDVVPVWDDVMPLLDVLFFGHPMIRRESVDRPG